MSVSRKRVLGSIVLGAVLAAGSWVRADDEDHLAKAPAVVQATVKKILGKGKLEGFDVEKADGKTVYDVDMEIGGTPYAMLVNEAGEVIQREVEVALVMVPQVVIDTGMKAHSDATIKEASIITRDGKMFYELEMMVGKVEHDVEISAKGKLLGESIAKAEAPEAKDKKEADEKDEKDEKKDSK